jgi:hypothetical protein
LLYLECVCVAGSLPVTSSPKKAGATDVDMGSGARWFLAIPDKKRSMPRPDSSVVERGPEKAGVGGSIPSLATNIFNNLRKCPGKISPVLYP